MEVGVARHQEDIPIYSDEYLPWTVASTGVEAI